MNIPNYDEKNSKKKFKQLYSYMPNDTFRMLICGNSGSGKTNLLFHMIMEPLLFYDQIYLYGKNLEQEKYQKMKKEMEDIESNINYNPLILQNDDILPVTCMENDGSQNIVIFDDYVCEKNKKDLVDYFIQGRHKNCSVIYLSQSFYKTPKDIRLNCSHYCIYDFPSKREKSMICQELNVPKEKYLEAIDQPYSFLYVDKPMKKMKKNFYGNI